MRDIGGVATRDGRRVKPGLLFRSGEPRKLGEDAIRALDAVGLMLVCDMRADVERHYRPVEHAGYQRVRRLTRDIESSNADLWARLEDDAVEREEVRGTMIDVYRRLPEEQAPLIRELIAAVAAGETPLLFHCAAGKDRTGFAAALLLALCDVPDETILADYAETERWMITQRERFMRKKKDQGQNTELWEPLFTCDPDYLLTALGIVRGAQGGLPGWLESIGVEKAQIAAARDHLVERG
jgi:protein-tyrosine phosphatase